MTRRDWTAACSASMKEATAGKYPAMRQQEPPDRTPPAEPTPPPEEAADPAVPYEPAIPEASPGPERIPKEEDAGPDA